MLCYGKNSPQAIVADRIKIIVPWRACCFLVPSGFPENRITTRVWASPLFSEPFAEWSRSELTTGLGYVDFDSAWRTESNAWRFQPQPDGPAVVGMESPRRVLGHPHARSHRAPIWLTLASRRAAFSLPCRHGGGVTLDVADEWPGSPSCRGMGRLTRGWLGGVTSGYHPPLIATTGRQR